MNKDVLLMESGGVYLFAEVQYTLTDDSFDHAFGTEHCTGGESEIERFFYRIGDYETGKDIEVKADSFPKEAISKFDDIIDSEFPSVNEFKDSQY